MAASKFKILGFIFLILPIIIAQDCNNEIKAIMYRKKDKRYEIFQGQHVYQTSTLRNGIPLVDRNQSTRLENWNEIFLQTESLQAATEDPDNNVHIITDPVDSKKSMLWRKLPNSQVETISIGDRIESMSYDYEDYDFVYVKYDSFLDDRYLKDIKGKTLLKDKHIFPSAMTTNVDTNDTIIIWDSDKYRSDRYFQWFDIRRDVIWDDVTHPPPIAVRDLRPATHWIGCPQNMCLEGKIDSIIYIPRLNFFEIRREYYSYSLDKLHPTARFLEPKKSMFFVDTSFYDGTYVVLVIGNYLYYGSDMIDRNEKFPELSGKTIQAAYTMSRGDFDIYFYLSDSTVYKYRKDGDKYNLLYGNHSFEILRGNIDAIYYDETSKIFYLFKDDYHAKYQILRDKIKLLGIESNYVNLWKCAGATDPIFRLGVYFGSSSIEDYHNLVSKYRKPSFVDPDAINSTTPSKSDEITTLTTTDGELKAEDDKGKSWTTIEIAMVVIAGFIVFVLFICLIYFCVRRKKINSGLKIRSVLNDNNFDTGFVSTTTEVTQRPGLRHSPRIIKK